MVCDAQPGSRAWRECGGRKLNRNLRPDVASDHVYRKTRAVIGQMTQTRATPMVYRRKRSCASSTPAYQRPAMIGPTLVAHKKLARSLWRDPNAGASEIRAVTGPSVP